MSKTQNDSPEHFDSSHLLRTQKHQHIAVDSSIVNGSSLVQHDIGVVLKPITGSETKSQRFRILDGLSGEWKYRCARVFDIIEKIALHNNLWAHLSRFSSL